MPLEDVSLLSAFFKLEGMECEWARKEKNEREEFSVSIHFQILQLRQKSSEESPTRFISFSIR